MDLSVVAVTHEMEREWPRTFHTITQQAVMPEITCLESRLPSPVRVMNQGVEAATEEIVLCLIDGARMLSPGICRKVLQAFRLFDDPFVYTIGMHLGPERQNILADRGWNEDEEDALLATVDWRRNGYELFNIASFGGGSQEDSFWSGVSESNCFAVKRETYHRLGGYDERFTSPGGGLCNLEIFKRFHKALTPVQLLGEATFHQWHGGVASNVPYKSHPKTRYLEEYERIFGEPYAYLWNRPYYLGDIPKQAEWVFCD